LLELEMDASALATEALSTSFSDMGAQALKLLAERGGATEGQQLLRETMLSKTDGLELEAAKLLRADMSELEVAALGVGAAAKGLRQDSLSTLLKAYERETSAKEAVHRALKSRFDDMRHRVAGALASMKVHDAYDVLVDMLQSEDASVQRQGIDGLRRLGDAKAAPAMLDRVDHDEQGTAAAQHLIEGAAAFRDLSIVDRLMAYIDRDENRWPAFRGVLTLSGHDQRIDDPSDEHEDKRWLERQHPRHDELLAKLLEVSYQIADGRMLHALIPKARWAQSEGVVDSALVSLVTFSQDHIKHAAIEALGWRLRKRNGSPDALLRVAREGSPEAQFFASEALALSGRDGGMSVLMTAVTFLDNFEWRKRAVLALGELGDPRALDQLLEIVREEHHPLRAPAAQALGHMAKTPKADEIFALLVTLSQGYYDLAEAALIGLRHFNTQEAWRVLRERASANGWRVRRKAAEVLRHDTSEATIEVLAQMIREETDYDAASSAAQSLRAIYGTESLETDYILVQGLTHHLPEQQESVERLRQHGDAKRILEVLPKIQPSNEDAFLKPLVTALLAREPLPVAEVSGVLDADEDRTATVAARIVGRAGMSASAEADKVVAGAKRAHELLEQNLKWRKLGKHNAASRTAALVERYALMLWACGRLKTGLEQLLEAVAMPFEPLLRPAHEEALKALSAPWVGKEGVAALEGASTGLDAQLRAVAISGLKQAAPHVAKAKLGETLEDASAFNRLLARGEADDAAKEVLRGAADNVHYQGVALPHMVASVDIEGLLATMRDAELADEARLGALESLSTIAAPELDDELAALGKNEEEDEDLRKAAWRALRRAKRLRAKREAQAEVGR
ncbi:MAG: HEAT repeat domain-containing protein, partial [Myxococcota bacterium]